MTSTAARPLVAVFGSANLDVSMRVHVLPRPGETVVAASSVTGPGGKGINQAVAISRAGVAVTLLTAVGADDAATELMDALDGFGVDTSRTVRQRAGPTGRAHITVDDAGENSIVVASGANATVSAAYAEQVADVLTDAAVLVVQGELPAEATRTAIRIASTGGTRIVANLAPYFDLGELAAAADPLVVNEIEAAQLVDAPIVDAESVRQLAARFAAVARSVVVTLGSAGAVLCHGDEVTEFPAHSPAAVVDTTGAGDAFVGVLAAALASGSSLEQACAAAVEAATRTVETSGAAASYPIFALPAVQPGGIA